jgi:hypothetical protein
LADPQRKSGKRPRELWKQEIRQPPENEDRENHDNDSRPARPRDAPERQLQQFLDHVNELGKRGVRGRRGSRNITPDGHDLIDLDHTDRGSAADIYHADRAISLGEMQIPTLHNRIVERSMNDPNGATVGSIDDADAAAFQFDGVTHI